MVEINSCQERKSDTCSKSFDDKEDEVNTCGTVNNTSVSDVPSTTTLPIDKTVQRNHIGDEISDVIRQLGDEYQQEVGHNVSDERENDVIAPNQVSTNVDIKENSVRRHDIDILPKIVYSHSPTVTALLRADVTRYLEFRFVSRLLAFVSDDNQYETKAGISSNDANNQVNSKRLVGRVVKIPVCRSDVFKTRLLSLHQKRALGSFFEWCFHLIINDTQHDATSVNCDDDYSTYENRPFQDFLTEKRKLDKFTQQLLITNLSFANQLIKTKEAIFRIRRLLFSMGRFGPYPILWPMYGSGDLTQGYCRMSAVFGAIFCLECTVKKIESVSVSEATTTVASESSLSSLSQSVPVINTNDDIIVHLSNGKQVRTKCVVLSPECVPFSWISSHITQWCARATLITDRSLLSDDCKPTDISLLAYSSNKIQDDSYLDPILIIECQIEKPNKSYGDLCEIEKTDWSLQSLVRSSSRSLQDHTTK
ncbi:unnamed protein product [Heterobilharzia americana]|nr:unnamed protein product [Heterobilharzia americana]